MIPGLALHQNSKILLILQVYKGMLHSSVKEAAPEADSSYNGCYPASSHVAIKTFRAAKTSGWLD